LGEKVKIYCFWQQQASGKGSNVRPLSWADPERVIEPMWVQQSPEVLAWLEAHGNPQWRSDFSPHQNMKALRDALGYWPEPYAWAEGREPELNDSLDNI